MTATVSEAFLTLAYNWNIITTEHISVADVVLSLRKTFPLYPSMTTCDARECYIGVPLVAGAGISRHNCTNIRFWAGQSYGQVRGPRALRGQHTNALVCFIRITRLSSMLLVIIQESEGKSIFIASGRIGGKTTDNV